MKRAILTCKVLLMASLVSTFISCRDAKTEATTEQTSGLEKVVDNTLENKSLTAEKIESEAKEVIEDAEGTIEKIEGEIDSTKYKVEATIEESAKTLKDEIKKGS